MNTDFIVTILFFLGTIIAIKVQPNTDSWITIYGVKSFKNENASGFKIEQMTLIDGRVINKPTIEDIRENNLLTYHSDEELNDNLVFQTSTLN